jgi:hypothetical protein
MYINIYSIGISEKGIMIGLETESWQLGTWVSIGIAIG